MDSVRLDRWLCAARIFKSRTQANQACVGGHVKVTEARVKPRHTLRIGDEVCVQSAHGSRTLEVLALADRRLSAPKARELYVDHSPPTPPSAEVFLRRERGAGRPTKRDRRMLRKLRGLD
jgi:ribosome-associated heat shock protein Hsp15